MGLVRTVVLAGTGFAVIAACQALPLHTSGRWILDASNQRVKLRCVNWAGHLEGFNCVRLTYSIDHALNPNVSIADTFANAAVAAGVPAENLTALYRAAVVANPFLGHATTTTRDVFGAVIDTLWERGVMTVLDNHVSRASWCCGLTDGNGWWDDASGYVATNSRYFQTDRWLSGLQAMAAWAGSGNHPGVVAMSLRNELRAVLLQDTNGHADWYRLIEQAGELVHQANQDVLVVVGGVFWATDLSFLRLHRPLNTTAWAGKHVWEWHSYSFTLTFPFILPCELLQQAYSHFAGFLLKGNETNTGPLLLSEFGVDQTGGDKDGLSDMDSKYLSCMTDYLEGNDADWAVWAFQGSYYVREGKIHYNETWGLMNYDWTALRNPRFLGMLGNITLVTQAP